MKKINKIQVSLTLALALTMMVYMIFSIFDIIVNARGNIQSLIALFVLIVVLTSAFYNLLSALEE